MILRLCNLLAILLTAFTGYSQFFNPGADEIFKENEVLEVRITLSEQDNDFLHREENRWSETYVKADVSFYNSDLSNINIEDVGLRLRGNTARGHNKRAYKIDFKEFGGEKFESYKKLNLKPNVNDPTVIRELLTMHLMRIMNVPAPRVAPATLYINEAYMGVYLIVEQIDDEFIDKRLNTETGYLYKCAYGSTLEDNGQVFDAEQYESKLNEEIDDRSHLNHFVQVLNQSSNEDFKEEINKVLDVDRYLRYLAVEAITGHWDGYSYLNNNYYLYLDEKGRATFIAYDTDNTWGIDWVNRDWATRDLNHFYRHNQPRPLTSRILAIPDYQALYLGYLDFLFRNFFTAEYLFPMFDQLQGLLAYHVAMDSYFDDSFGFNPETFSAAYHDGSIGHVAYGLRSFVETRRETGIPVLPAVTLGTNVDKAPTIYPNPCATPYFTVSNIANANTRVNIYNLSGSKIPTEFIPINYGELKVKSPARPGHYIITVNDTILKLWIE